MSGTWSCATCNTTNPTGSMSCVSCGTLRGPGQGLTEVPSPTPGPSAFPLQVHSGIIPPSQRRGGKTNFPPGYGPGNYPPGQGPSNSHSHFVPYQTPMSSSEMVGVGPVREDVTAVSGPGGSDDSKTPMIIVAISLTVIAVAAIGAVLFLALGKSDEKTATETTTPQSVPTQELQTLETTQPSTESDPTTPAPTSPPRASVERLPGVPELAYGSERLAGLPYAYQWVAIVGSGDGETGLR